LTGAIGRELFYKVGQMRILAKTRIFITLSLSAILCNESKRTYAIFGGVTKSFGPKTQDLSPNFTNRARTARDLRITPYLAVDFASAYNASSFYRTPWKRIADVDKV
jgi:hypothetical protein